MLDVHTHCHQRFHRGGLWEKYSAPVYDAADQHVDPDVTPERYDAAMSDGGVDLAFLFGIRATAAGVDTPNQWVQEFAAACSTPTVPFMALDLNDDDLMDQFTDGLNRGFRGVKLYPTLALFDGRDARHDEFFRAATKAGVIVLWHMGATPIPLGSLALSHPLIVDEVARRHPELTQIIAHMGHPWQRETIVTIRKNRRVFSDVSASWARPTDGFFALVRAQEWDVVGKLLFASDFPHWTPSEAKEGLIELAGRSLPGWEGILPSTVEWLLDGNHRQALGID